MSEFSDLFGEWGMTSDGQPTVTIVETYKGPGRAGPVLAEPVERRGLVVMPQTRLVRNSDGQQQLSTTAIYGELEERVHFPVGSRVKLADGRTTSVLSMAAPDQLELGSFMVVNLE